MGLLQKAIETYDAMSHLAGVEQADKEPLAPPGHIIAKAQIEITIDQDGRFIQARKTERKIPIPVSEESAGRTSAPAAHALCEQIGYLLPGTDKCKLYLDGLAAWAHSEFGHPKLSAVLEYVEHGTIKDDLTQAGLLKLKEDGTTVANEKELVSWIVVGMQDDPGPVWNDKHLLKLYGEYYTHLRKDDEPVACMLEGRMTFPAKQNLKGIVSLNGNAKIISANDSTNFTYRGRFVTDEEALTIGYEGSQKAHNALKWIVANEGVVRGGRTFVCWNPRGRRVQPVFSPLISAETSVKPKEMTAYRELLKKKIDGYRAEFPDDESVVVAAFDAATTGRLAVTCYSELLNSDFLDHLKYWDETCCWYDSQWGISSPSLYTIINCAFGTQRGEEVAAKFETDDKQLASQLQRLLICKLNRSGLPLDIMQAISAKAGNLQILTAGNRRQLLFAACAVIRKYYIDHKKEEIDVALEPERMDRSYQFGRLLAVMEKIERDTYDRGETREPNAIRLQSVFVQRPGYAARLIMDQLKSGYYPRLKPGQRVYYDRLIGEIMAQIDAAGLEQYNKPLSETYLPGYYLQRNALYTKKEESNETEETDNEV